MNGKTSWISTSNNAIWFNPASDDWLIGSASNFGTTGGISSTGNQGKSSCPYNVPNDSWQYAANGVWTIADANDVSIECLTGNEIFQILLYTNS